MGKKSRGQRIRQIQNRVKRGEYSLSSKITDPKTVNGVFRAIQKTEKKTQKR